MFAEDQLERLRTFPGISRDDLIRYLTLMPADVAFLDSGRGRGPADRRGLAVAPATLPWLGFVHLPRTTRCGRRDRLRIPQRCHALVSAPIGGYLRAACRPCATVRDGSRSVATAGRSRRGEHPGARVNMAETLIGGHASNRSSPSDVRHSRRM